MRASRSVASHALAGIVGGVMSACAPSRAPAPLLVLAAADLREALPAVAAAYRRAGGDSVVLAFGATGDLAVQIANGAPADLFFSADEDALARLAAQHAVVGGTRRVYAVGRLALVSALGAPPVTALSDLTRPAVRTVVIADPAHAPYGRAARQALEHAGVWDGVRAKLVYAPNVAQAFRFVQGGNADAGLVALSAVSTGAAGTRPRFTLVDTALYAPIRQAVAVVATSGRPREAARFLEYATGSAGFAVLRRYGFAPPPSGAALAGAAPP